MSSRDWPEPVVIAASQQHTATVIPVAYFRNTAGADEVVKLINPNCSSSFCMALETLELDGGTLYPGWASPSSVSLQAL